MTFFDEMRDIGNRNFDNYVGVPGASQAASDAGSAVVSTGDPEADYHARRVAELNKRAEYLSRAHPDEFNPAIGLAQLHSDAITDPFGGSAAPNPDLYSPEQVNAITNRETFDYNNSQPFGGTLYNDYYIDKNGRPHWINPSAHQAIYDFGKDNPQGALNTALGIDQPAHLPNYHGGYNAPSGPVDFIKAGDNDFRVTGDMLNAGLIPHYTGEYQYGDVVGGYRPGAPVVDTTSWVPPAPTSSVGPGTQPQGKLTWQGNGGIYQDEAGNAFHKMPDGTFLSDAEYMQRRQGDINSRTDQADWTFINPKMARDSQGNTWTQQADGTWYNHGTRLGSGGPAITDSNAIKTALQDPGYLQRRQNFYSGGAAITDPNAIRAALEDPGYLQRRQDFYSNLAGGNATGLGGLTPDPAYLIDGSNAEMQSYNGGGSSGGSSWRTGGGLPPSGGPDLPPGVSTPPGVGGGQNGYGLDAILSNLKNALNFIGENTFNSETRDRRERQLRDQWQRDTERAMQSTINALASRGIINSTSAGEVLSDVAGKRRDAYTNLMNYLTNLTESARKTDLNAALGAGNLALSTGSFIPGYLSNMYNLENLAPWIAGQAQEDYYNKYAQNTMPEGWSL